MTTNFFSPLSFVAVFGSGIDKIQDPSALLQNVPIGFIGLPTRDTFNDGDLCTIGGCSGEMRRLPLGS
jgi:hypothetical protein